MTKKEVGDLALSGQHPFIIGEFRSFERDFRSGVKNGKAWEIRNVKLNVECNGHPMTFVHEVPRQDAQGKPVDANAWLPPVKKGEPCVILIHLSPDRMKPELCRVRSKIEALSA